MARAIGLALSETKPAAIVGRKPGWRHAQGGGAVQALRPALKGLPGDLCPCPHWGYVLKGTVRMHTADGHHDYAAGQAFYWGPGHAPEIVDDAEYVDFSPTAEFEEVIRHIARQG